MTTTTKEPNKTAGNPAVGKIDETSNNGGSSMNPKVQAAMEKLLDTLKNGDLRPISLAVFHSQLDRPSDKWSFLNRVMMYVFDTEDARGFRQWGQVDRHVKQGVRAFYILAPLIKKFKNPETGEDEPKIYGFKGVPVFRVEDTEGAALPEDNFELSIPCAFDGIIDELGIEVGATSFNGSTFGYFAPKRNLIKLASPDISVFLHELSHAVDHSVNGKLKNGQNPNQEVVADFSAAVIGRLLGYDIPLGNVKEYLEHYATNLSQVATLFNRIGAVVEFVVSRTSIDATAATTEKGDLAVTA